MQNKIIVGILTGFIFVDALLIYLALTISPIKLKRNSFRYEYGEEISTDIRFYVNANESVLDSVKLNLSGVSPEVGVYQASIEYFGEIQTFEIIVEDTIKPKVQLKKVQWNIQLGESIKAADLIKDIDDFSTTTVYFYDNETQQKFEEKSYTSAGSYIERIIVEDFHHNQSASLRVKIVVETNKIPPTFKGIEDMVIHVGEDYDLMKDVKAIDDIEGDITDRIIVEASVNSHIPGEYKVTYRVSDNMGNVSKKVRKVTVIKDDN